MGLFDFLRRNGAKNSIRDVDATMAAIVRDQERREDEWHKRDALLRRDGRPIALERLETCLPGLPVANGDHLAKHVLTADVEAGVTRLSRVEWYAWPDEARDFGVQLNALEDDLASAISGVRGAPRLRTDLSHVAAQCEGDEHADGARVWLTVMPLTKTGRTPRYPIEISYTTMGERDLTGSRGTVCYLKDGSIGKVDAMYERRSVSYEVAWRMQGPRLAPAWVYSYDLKSGAQASVWRS